VASTVVARLKKKIGGHWKRETSLRARVKNIGHLLTGNLIGSVIGVAAFMVTARALGPADYGVLALIYSYTRAVEKLVSFQSWQPLIKYGATYQGPEHVDDLRALMKFGLLVDAGAAVLAAFVAIAVALLFGPLVGIPPEALNLTILYSLVLMLNINGMPTATMRLAGRFRMTAYGSLASGALRLLLCGYGLMTGQGLAFFVLAWAGTQAVGYLTFLTMALVQLHRQGVRRLLTAPMTGVVQRNPGLWSFTLGSNLELTVRSSAGEFDTLLVGALSDSASAGLYHVAKRFARLILQLGVQVQAVLYPDVARLWAQRAYQEFGRAILQMELILFGFGAALLLATVVAIEPILVLAAGPKFAGAGPLITMQMVAVMFTLSGSAARTALFAMGRQPAVLLIATVGTVVFFAVALALIPLIGAMGANIAHSAMALVVLIGLAVTYRRALPRPSHDAAAETTPTTPAAEAT
jgi:O-antigen/teichoic acid export membrane protein